MIIKIKPNAIVETILMSGMVIAYLLPIVYVTISIWLVLAIELLYVLYVFIFEQDSIVKSSIFKAMLLILLYAALMILLTEGSNSNGLSTTERFISYFNQYVKMFFPVLLCYRAYRNLTKKAMVFLVFISVICSVVVMINTYYALIENPLISRTWDLDLLRSQNIATYEYVYAFSAYVCLLLLVFRQSKKWLARCFMVIAGVSLFALLIMMQYTLSLILPFIAITAVFAKRNMKSQSGMVFVTFALLLLIILLPNILSTIAQWFSSESISSRLMDLSAILRGGEIDQARDTADRLSIYTDSFRLFFQSPIWGNRYTSLNTHSTILGAFVDTGLIGGIPHLALLLSMKSRMSYFLSDSEFDAYLGVFYLWILDGLVNPIHSAFPFNFAVFFICPLVIHLCVKEDSNSIYILDHKSLTQN